MHVFLWILENFYQKQYGVVVFDHSVKYSYCDIFEQLYFWKCYFLIVFESNIFQSITRVNFSEQLFLQNRCFFEELLFQNSHFFPAFFPQNIYFFRAKLLPGNQTLRAGNSLVQLPFRTATHRSYRGATFSKQILLHNINFFKKSKILKKATFSEKRNSALPTFSGELHF